LLIRNERQGAFAADPASLENFSAGVDSGASFIKTKNIDVISPHQELLLGAQPVFLPPKPGEARVEINRQFRAFRLLPNDILRF
jgi:hypothetical protein